MLILISPAKKLDYDTPAPTDTFTQPEHLARAGKLIAVLQGKSQADIAKLMHLSDKLAALNVKRYQAYSTPFTEQNAKQALFAFKGDVYAAMQADTFDDVQIQFAQDHLRILSGLYGLLKPLDLMQPYRLEMGTRLKTDTGNNLYDFWDMAITDAVNTALANTGSDTLVNLASQEYFKSVKTAKVNGTIITPQFKELKTDKNDEPVYKIVGILAKRARGLMSRYIIENGLTDAAKLKDFDWEGYGFRDDMSKGNTWVFTRDAAT